MTADTRYYRIGGQVVLRHPCPGCIAKVTLLPPERDICRECERWALSYGRSDKGSTDQHNPDWRPHCPCGCGAHMGCFFEDDPLPNCRHACYATDCPHPTLCGPHKGREADQ
jgi:hypothetical protein